MNINPNEDKPTDWFEELYSESNLQGDGVPWANMGTHPYFQEWLEKHLLQGNGRKAMVVGCGMGDDAIELEKRGFQVTAFDVSDSAINLCRKRFPDSEVDFVQADLFDYPENWIRGFDFILEIYTVQALPPRYEAQAIKGIADLVKENGQLLVITQVNTYPRSFEKGPPWLLTPDHIEKFEAQGLRLDDQIKKLTQSGENWAYISLFSRQ